MSDHDADPIEDPDGDDENESVTYVPGDDESGSEDQRGV